MTTLLSRAPERDGRLCSCLDDAASALAAGDVVVLSDQSRAVLVCCASSITTQQMSFIIRHSSGFVQVALHERVCDCLQLPEAIPTIRDPQALGYGQCVGVDAKDGIGTGISGADRARTARLLAYPHTTAADLVRPGHLVPVRVAHHGSHHVAPTAAAALDLADRGAPTVSGAVFADLVGITDLSSMADSTDAEAFARRHCLVNVNTPLCQSNSCTNRGERT